MLLSICILCQVIILGLLLRNKSMRKLQIKTSMLLGKTLYSSLPTTKINFKSKGEELCWRLTAYHFDELPKSNYRPEWLDGLELDVYLDSKRVAIEYQGIQHYEFPTRYVATWEKFQAQLMRDVKKTVICQQRGVRLIQVPYLIDYHDSSRSNDLRTMRLNNYLSDCFRNMK